LSKVNDLKETIVRCRKALEDKRSLRKSLLEERLVDGAVKNVKPSANATTIKPRPLPKLDFPTLRKYMIDIKPFSELENVIDQDRIVVNTGFAELGHYGNARTRWDIEREADFSPQGHLELAWVVGLIRHQNTNTAGSKSPYCGWIDSATSEPVPENDIKMRYGEFITNHCGTRPIEAEFAPG